MASQMTRRDFMKTAPAATLMLAGAGGARAPRFSNPGPVTNKLECFDYRGVALGESRWRDQYRSARDFYFGVSNDDILHGFRAAAGLPAPGKTLGGWCQRDSSTVFGQWLSGMSRMFRATGDDGMRDKAVRLAREFARTVKPDGDCGMDHQYPYEKLVCGLVDLAAYADFEEAVPLLEKVTDWAIENLDRERVPAAPRPWELHSGKPLEWYTLSENLYRAFQLTGNPKFKSFADVWLYPAFWEKFAHTAEPADAYGVHAYSHVNSFSGAAMAYAVTGDPALLRILRNAYDFLQNTQCYATGGFGPAERLMPLNGNLGRSLDYRMDSFETPCGSWAGFKMARYLMSFTGEARYGDWIERLLYNGIGAALPMKEGGKVFYYADYRIAGVKYYHRSSYTCCSGTYIQNVADYHNLIYFKQESGLCVNLYLPSQVAWRHPEGEVRLVQTTRYPEDEAVTLDFQMPRSLYFTLKLRVPAWAEGFEVKVNGAPSGTACVPGDWAVLTRAWSPGDKVEVRIPLRFRKQAIDRWFPRRVAVVRGPVVFVQEGNTHEPIFPLPEEDADLDKWLQPAETPGIFRAVPKDGSRVQGRFMPYYRIGESYPCRMYFDMDELPVELW